MKLPVLALALALALPAWAKPKPIITVEGVAAATHLTATTRAAISQQITALNAKLELMRGAKTDDDLKAIHEQCLALHDAIVGQLNDEQKQAFYAYLHAQMTAAGIDVSKFAGHHAHHE